MYSDYSYPWSCVPSDGVEDIAAGTAPCTQRGPKTPECNGLATQKWGWLLQVQGLSGSGFERQCGHGESMQEVGQTRYTGHE